MSRETPTRAPTAGSRLYGGRMAPVKQIQVTFDCAEPERVARFWCEVLGYVVPPPPAISTKENRTASVAAFGGTVSCLVCKDQSATNVTHVWTAKLSQASRNLPSHPRGLIGRAGRVSRPNETSARCSATAS